jgi:hypothetical protein
LFSTKLVGTLRGMSCARVYRGLTENAGGVTVSVRLTSGTIVFVAGVTAGSSGVPVASDGGASSSMLAGSTLPVIQISFWAPCAKPYSSL